MLSLSARRACNPSKRLLAALKRLPNPTRRLAHCSCVPSVRSCAAVTFQCLAVRAGPGVRSLCCSPPPPLPLQHFPNVQAGVPCASNPQASTLATGLLATMAPLVMLVDTLHRAFSGPRPRGAASDVLLDGASAFAVESNRAARLRDKQLVR